MVDSDLVMDLSSCCLEILAYLPCTDFQHQPSLSGHWKEPIPLLFHTMENRNAWNADKRGMYNTLHQWAIVEEKILITMISTYILAYKTEESNQYFLLLGHHYGGYDVTTNSNAVILWGNRISYVRRTQRIHNCHKLPWSIPQVICLNHHSFHR